MPRLPLSKKDKAKPAFQATFPVATSGAIDRIYPGEVALFWHEVGTLLTHVGLYRRLGAVPRCVAPAPVRRLRPNRRVGLCDLPRPPRAVCAAMLCALWGAGAVARSSLRRVQWPAAGVRECARRTRV